MTKIDKETMTVWHTQGDTFEVPLSITVKEDGQDVPYVPAAGDVIRIAIKSAYTDDEPIIRKEVPHDTMTIRIEAEETELLMARKKPYVYDVELTTPDGFKDTFLDRKLWYSTEEVD